LEATWVIFELNLKEKVTCVYSNKKQKTKIELEWARDSLIPQSSSQIHNHHHSSSSRIQS